MNTYDIWSRNATHRLFGNFTYWGFHTARTCHKARIRKCIVQVKQWSHAHVYCQIIHKSPGQPNSTYWRAMCTDSIYVSGPLLLSQ